jgi:hypothetical protein
MCTGAALVVLAAGLLPALSAAEDILGPIGPLPAPAPERRPARRLMAVSLAVGFGVLSVYLTLRRRRRRRHPVAEPAARTPQLDAEALLQLPDDELYAELFRVAREVSGHAATATPLEVSRAGPAAAGGDWAPFCCRVADVLYAGAEAESGQREADLQLVRGLTARKEEPGDGL